MTGDHKRSEGGKCKTCQQTEARCAFAGSCCGACSHFGHLDTAGNEPHAGISGPIRQACDPCRRNRRACIHLAVAS